MTDEDRKTRSESSQPESPREAGKNMQNPEEIDSNDEEERDYEKEAAMTDETPTTETEQMEREINKVLPGSDPLTNLRVVEKFGVVFQVLSARNGSVTSHEVDLRKMTCTCGDSKWNTDDSREICAHMAKVLLEAPSIRTNEQKALDALLVAQAQANEAADKARNYANAIENEYEARESGRSPAGSDPSTSTNKSDTSGHSVDASEAAEKLQAAYDEAVNDMQVKAANGYVWVQTGQDTPDTLPGPGNVEVFEAFLQNAEQVIFVHDNHELVSQKPGEWWKNAIEPSEVDDYISEVLE